MAQFKSQAGKKVMGVRTVIKFNAEGLYSTEDESEIKLLRAHTASGDAVKEVSDKVEKKVEKKVEPKAAAKPAAKAKPKPEPKPKEEVEDDF